MKPTKNNIFCPLCGRTKMLFESKSKALNFIRFNATEIREQSGVAPTRAYYCQVCCGWHITSRELQQNERSEVGFKLSYANRLLSEGKIVDAYRFVCYAADRLDEIKTVYLPSKADEKIEKRIHEQKAQIYRAHNKESKEFSTLQHELRFYIPLMAGNGIEVPVLESFKRDKFGATYTVRPQFFLHKDGKYYYALGRFRLNQEEVMQTLELNQLSADENLQNVTLHQLNIIQCKPSSFLPPKSQKQFACLQQVISPNIIDVHARGKRLHVMELADKCKQVYLKSFTMDYWIQLGKRNVHCFLGKGTKIACLVSTLPLEEERIITVFKNIKNFST